MPAFLSLGRTCVSVHVAALTKDLCREEGNAQKPLPELTRKGLQWLVVPETLT